ncbi:formylglycine-generating enzyme family protein [bacterium]|nr:formylglycine-generating enzyme family protein [candidate division CSSED10-310 bacterium]
MGVRKQKSSIHFSAVIILFTLFPLSINAQSYVEKTFVNHLHSGFPIVEPVTMIYVPPGIVFRGLPEDEPCIRKHHHYLYPAVLTHGYYLMETEVTRGMWADLQMVQNELPTDPSDEKYSPTRDHPVQRVTWLEAVLFANLLSCQYGYRPYYYSNSELTNPILTMNFDPSRVYRDLSSDGHRLPTEAEWENACRAGTTTVFSCPEPNYTSDNCRSCMGGSHPILEEYCVYCVNHKGGPDIVGSMLPNPWGFLDMHGNIEEWCWDVGGDYSTDVMIDPTGSGINAAFRTCISRGGNWYVSALGCRSRDRSYTYIDARFNLIGFRLARSACDMEPVSVKLQMPSYIYAPGSPFRLDLQIENSGPPLTGCCLFTAFWLGADDFWLYPSWSKYPSEIDWETLDIPGYSAEVLNLIPDFVWPENSGEYYGALFISALIHENQWISNLAASKFGWSERSLPSPRPTSTPTPEPPTGPTPTAPAGYVHVSSGSFTMGSPPDEPCRDADEEQREVVIGGSFDIMRTEVTRRMWADLKSTQPSLPDDPSDITYSPTLDHPVQQLNFYKVALFANLLSLEHDFPQCYYRDENLTIPLDASNYLDRYCYLDQKANGYRLPTGEEWEYVCRAGTTTAFSCPEENYSSSTCYSSTPGTLPILEQYSVFVANALDGKPEKVTSRLPNPWGLYDMHGNVSEWCYEQLWPHLGEITARGGTFRSNPRYCRSADRSFIGLDYGNHERGFRLVRQVSASPSTPPVTPVPMTFSTISPGTFTMGSPYIEPCVSSSKALDEHQVRLTRDIAIMQTEVTRQMWFDLRAMHTDLPEDPSLTKVSPTMNHPVQNALTNETALFANLLSLSHGLMRSYYKDPGFSIPLDSTNYEDEEFFCNFDAGGYRLPTEAEWEYACRAGTEGPFSFYEPEYHQGTCYGCDPDVFQGLDQYCVYCGNSPGSAEPASSKYPNPWGLYDMHGNVSEYCWDYYGDMSVDVMTDQEQVDPTGPLTGDQRILRGGNWDCPATDCRSAARTVIVGNQNCGFRLVKSAVCDVTLMMAGDAFKPGDPFWLDVHLLNSGSEFTGARLFVVFMINLNEIWFLPDWSRYPTDLSGLEVNLPDHAERMINIIPEFSWPAGAEVCDEGMFVAYLIHNDRYISNFAFKDFRWIE